MNNSLSYTRVHSSRIAYVNWILNETTQRVTDDSIKILGYCSDHCKILIDGQQHFMKMNLLYGHSDGEKAYKYMTKYAVTLRSKPLNLNKSSVLKNLNPKQRN